MLWGTHMVGLWKQLPLWLVHSQLSINTSFPPLFLCHGLLSIYLPPLQKTLWFLDVWIPCPQIKPKTIGYLWPDGSVFDLIKGWRMAGKKEWKKKKADQEKDFKEENRNFSDGKKMCGRRGYCRNHITRRAPLREKMVSVKDKSLRTQYFLCSIWRRVHVGSVSQWQTNSPWDLQSGRGSSWAAGQLHLAGEAPPEAQAGQGWGSTPCSAAFQLLKTPWGPLFQETFLGHKKCEAMLEVDGLIDSEGLLTSQNGCGKLFKWIFSLFLNWFLFSTGKEGWMRLSLTCEAASLLPSRTGYWELLGLNLGRPLEGEDCPLGTVGWAVGPVPQWGEDVQEWPSPAMTMSDADLPPSVVLGLHFSKIPPQVIGVHIPVPKALS